MGYTRQRIDHERRLLAPQAHVGGTHLPNTEKLDKEVAGEPREQHLTDEKDVARQRALEHDGHVAGVKQLDRVRAPDPPVLGALDGDLESEPLQVDDGSEHERGGEQVHNVGQPLSVKGFLQSAGLVVPGEHDVEQGDDGSLEFGSTSGIDRPRGKRLPHDGFANVGRDEQVDTGSETVTFGQEFVEQEDDRGGGDELEDQEEDDTGTEGTGRTVQPGQDVDRSLTESDDEGKDCRGRRVEISETPACLPALPTLDSRF